MVLLVGQRSDRADRFRVVREGAHRVLAQQSPRISHPERIRSRYTPSLLDNTQGAFLTIQWIGSPNRTLGRHGFHPAAIVIHIMEADLSTVDTFFQDTRGGPDGPVSAHYGIGQQGEIHQYVGEGDAAWHAGKVDRPTWSLIKPGINPNWYTIGIEHEGMHGHPWSEEQYDASANRIAIAANRWAIPIDTDHIIRHSAIRAAKPNCPGSGVELDVLISLAQSVRLSGTLNNLVVQHGVIRAVTGGAVHIGAPTMDAEVDRAASPGEAFTITGWTSSGEAVHGNPHWYRLTDGNFLWAGATSEPTPALEGTPTDTA